MPANGKALVAYIRDRVPGATNQQIGGWAGLPYQQVTDWSLGAEPKHHHVVALGRGAGKLHLGLDAWSLLQAAQFDYVDGPWHESRDELLREWAELTAKLHSATLGDIRRVVSAAQQAFDEEG